MEINSEKEVLQEDGEEIVVEMTGCGANAANNLFNLNAE